MNNLFPQGLATGEAFCNRNSERKQLKDNIQNNQHTVLVAPRRYGKTSLVNQVIGELKAPCCEMDFLLTATPKAVENKIVKCVGDVLLKLLPRTKKARLKLLQLFKALNPELTLTAAGQKIKFHVDPGSSFVETNICDILMNLDKAAIAAKKRVIVFMDEFQQIGELKDKHVIEASIRHAVERSKMVSYIFSGSNRHLLLQMFNQRSRPFYHLCQIMPLSRIDESEHIQFIQKAAKKCWGKVLQDAVIRKILTVSECHTYYINVICHFFFGNNTVPTQKAIDQFWRAYITLQKPVISHDLSLLSNNQKTLLVALAKTPISQPYHQDFLYETRLTAASLKEAMNKLMQKDFIYIDRLNSISVLDPAVKFFIRKIIG
jgi:uncharacterized protein